MRQKQLRVSHNFDFEQAFRWDVLRLTNKKNYKPCKLLRPNRCKVASFLLTNGRKEAPVMQVLLSVSFFSVQLQNVTGAASNRSLFADGLSSNSRQRTVHAAPFQCPPHIQWSVIGLSVLAKAAFNQRGQFSHSLLFVGTFRRDFNRLSLTDTHGEQNDD